MSIRHTIPGLAIGAAVLFSALIDNAQPPKNRTPSEWAAQERYISAVGSRFSGKYDPDMLPFAAEVMDACGPNDPSMIVAMRAGAQSGKSTIVENALGYFIDDHAVDTLVVLPSNDEASKYAEVKFDEMVKVTPALTRKVFGRYGEERSKVMRKRFRGGYIQFSSAGNDKSLQMLTFGLIICEELGSWDAEIAKTQRPSSRNTPTAAVDRGDPFDQAIARGTTYGEDLKVLCPSTTGVAGKCRISDLVEAGDNRYLFNECPSCGDYFSIRFDQFHEHEGRVTVAAPCCGTLIEHHQKKDLIKSARFIPMFDSENPDNAVPLARDKNGNTIPWVIRAADIDAARNRDTEGRDKSFNWWQAHSTLPGVSWSIIWKKYKAAKDDPVKMTVFSQQVLAEPYQAAVDTPPDDVLLEFRGRAPTLKSPVRRGIIPPWAGFVTMAADLQGDRFEWAAYAWGPGPVSACIDHGVIPIPPMQNEGWRELSRVFVTQWQSRHLRPQTARKFGVDTAGHDTKMAYEYIMANPDVIGIAGAKGAKARFEPLVAAPRIRGRMKRNGRTERVVPLTFLNTHNLKKITYFGLQNALAAFKSQEITEGYHLFLHDDVNEDFCQQITAEQLIVDKARDTEYWDRISNGRPNEQLDLAGYNYAMAVIYGLRRMSDDDWRALFEREAIDPAQIDMGPLELAMRSAAPAALPRQSDLDKPKTPSWAEKLAALNARSGGNNA